MPGYIDFELGSDANNGSSMALAVKTLTGITAAKVTAQGTDWRIKASLPPSDCGINMTWTTGSKDGTLASALTKDIDVFNGSSGWVASANITVSANTGKIGNVTTITIAAGFTTGLMCYKPLAGSTDYSAYEQLSCHWRNTVATATSTYEIRLCSDAVGAVAVDTFVVPATGFAGLHALLINKGAALGAAIQSVALYCMIDAGAQVIQINNGMACLAASNPAAISLQSLVGKNTAAEPYWYPVKSITGTTLTLDNDNATTAAGGRPYLGTTGTVRLWRFETLKTTQATATNTVIQTLGVSGTVAAPLQITAGWDRTTMATQATWTRQDASTETAWTAFDGATGAGYGIQVSNFNYTTLKRLMLVRYNIGFNFATAFGVSQENVQYIGNVQAMNNPSAASINRDVWIINNGAGNPVAFTTAGASYWYNTVIMNNAAGNGLNACYGDHKFYNTVIKNGAGYAIQSEITFCTFYGLTTSDNVSGAINHLGGKLMLVNASIGEATEVNFPAANTLSTENWVQSHNHDLTLGNHKVFQNNGLVSSETGVDRRTASGLAWKLSPLSATARSVDYPTRLPLAKIYCTANSLVTVKAWFKRDSLSITGKLIAYGGRLAGVSADVSATTSGAINTYEELTISFTPTEAGVMEIEAHAYGGSTLNVWVDDMTIT